MGKINDSHCHLFSNFFFNALAKQKGIEPGEGIPALRKILGWEIDDTSEDLAKRWLSELDAKNVSRVALIASVPGDEESVAAAVKSAPDRFVGFFMLNPKEPGAVDRAKNGVSELGLRTICLFPAMHHFKADSDECTSIFEVAADEGANVFVHCGKLSLGVKKKLDLPQPFDMSLGDPMAVARTAEKFTSVPVIIPHFGAGQFKETLSAAKQASNIYLDTSSTNSWIEKHSGYDLKKVFEESISAIGSERLLFGSDSSFFPRGWNAEIYQTQKAVLDADIFTDQDRENIFSSNFDRLFF